VPGAHQACTPGAARLVPSSRNPVITFPGLTFAGRHSTSHLTNAGYPQFIAQDVNGYVELAVQWANRLDELSAIRKQLREQMAKSPLCDAPRFASDLISLLHHVRESRGSGNIASSPPAQ
jgi:predicted O-linked N-acetylglucosamine transferase (SPINDLY family)